MNLGIGDFVRFGFPQSETGTSRFFLGWIKEIYNTHVIIVDEKNVKLKVSFKNFSLIKKEKLFFPAFSD